MNVIYAILVMKNLSHNDNNSIYHNTFMQYINVLTIIIHINNH